MEGWNFFALLLFWAFFGLAFTIGLTRLVIQLEGGTEEEH